MSVVRPMRWHRRVAYRQERQGRQPVMPLGRDDQDQRPAGNAQCAGDDKIGPGASGNLRQQVSRSVGVVVAFTDISERNLVATFL